MEAKHGSNFDFKSDLDFPTLGSNVVPSAKRNSSPKEKALPLQNSNKESRDNSRSMSKGRGKKQNWKAVQVEFNNNSSSNGPRYQQRGSNRPRFGGSHVAPKPSSISDDQPFEFSYRGYRSGSRSRIRRARGGSAPHHFGRPTSVESTTPSSHSPTSDLSPTIMAIPYHPNYGAYVQQQIATVESPVDIEEAIRHQIEYYFSEENLIKDNYMRLNMTSEGFLSIQLISNFNKIKQFNTDIDTIARAIEASDKLEVVDGKMVRPVIDPLRWPLRTPLPPPVTSLMKNYVQPEVMVAPLHNGAIYQEVVPELDAADMMYQPGTIELVAAPVTDMVYQSVEEPIEQLPGYMGGMTFDEKAMYDYTQCYPAELQEQQTLDQDVAYDYDPCYPVDSQTEDDCQKEQTSPETPTTDTQPEEVPKEEKLTNGCNGHHSEDDTQEDDIVDTVSVAITDKVTYACYASEPKDCQKDIGFQQESIRCQQDVGHYQHMFAYVSS